MSHLIVKPTLKIFVILDSAAMEIHIPELGLDLDMGVELDKFNPDLVEVTLCPLLKLHGVTEATHNLEIEVTMKSEQDEVLESSDSGTPKEEVIKIMERDRKCHSDVVSDWHNDNKNKNKMYVDVLAMIEQVSLSAKKYEAHVAEYGQSRLKLVYRARVALTNLHRLGWLTYDATKMKVRDYVIASFKAMACGVPVSFRTGKEYDANYLFGSDITWFLRNWKTFSYPKPLFSLLKKLLDNVSPYGPNLRKAICHNFNRINFEEQSNAVVDFLKDKIMDVISEFMYECLSSGFSGLFWTMVTSIKDGFLKAGTAIWNGMSNVLDSVKRLFSKIGMEVCQIGSLVAAQLVLLPSIISSAYLFLGEKFSNGSAAIIELLTQGHDVPGMNYVSQWFNNRFSKHEQFVEQGRDEEGFISGLVSLAASMLSIHVEEPHIKKLCDFFSRHRFAGNVVSILSRNAYTFGMGMAYIVTKDNKYLIQDRLEVAYNLMDRAAAIFNDPKVEMNMFSNRQTITDIQNLYKDMEEEWLRLTCCKDIEPTVRHAYQRVYENVKRANNAIYANAVIYTGRKMPAWVYLMGAPGQGKTNSVEGILSAVHSTMREKYPHIASYRDEFNHAHIYSKAKTSEYFTGYKHQWVLMIDELFASSDATLRAEESMLLTSLVNDGTCPLDQAAIDDKGNSYMSSEIVVTTTNISDLNNVHLTCKEAVVRRLSFPLRCVRDGTLDLTCDNLDECWKYFIMDTVGNVPTSPYHKLLSLARVRTFEETEDLNAPLFCRFYDVVDALVDYLVSMHEEPSLGSKLMNQKWKNGRLVVSKKETLEEFLASDITPSVNSREQSISSESEEEIMIDPMRVEYDEQGIFDTAHFIYKVVKELVSGERPTIYRMTELLKLYTGLGADVTASVAGKYFNLLSLDDQEHLIKRLNEYYDKTTNGDDLILTYFETRDLPSVLIHLIFIFECGTPCTIEPYLKEIVSELNESYDIHPSFFVDEIHRWFEQVDGLTDPFDAPFMKHIIKRVLKIYDHDVKYMSDLMNRINLEPELLGMCQEWYLYTMKSEKVMDILRNRDFNDVAGYDTVGIYPIDFQAGGLYNQNLMCRLFKADFLANCGSWIAGFLLENRGMIRRLKPALKPFLTPIFPMVINMRADECLCRWHEDKTFMRRLFGYEIRFALKKIALVLVGIIAVVATVLLLVYAIIPAVMKAILPACMTPVVDSAWDVSSECGFCEQSIHKGNLAKPNKLQYRTHKGKKVYDVQGDDYDRMTIFSRNMCFVSVETTKTIFHCPAMWLTSGQLAVVRHYTMGDEVLHITLFTSDGNNGVKLSKKQFKISEPEGRDLLLVRIRPNIVCPVKNLVKRMFNKDDISAEVIKHVGRLEQTTDGSLFCTQYATGSKVYFDTDHEYCSNKLNMKWHNVYILEDGKGKAGDCGYPIIGGSELSCAKLAFPLIGLHIGRVADDSIVVPLWKSDVLSDTEMRRLFDTDLVDGSLKDRPFVEIKYDHQSVTLPGLFSKGKLDKTYFLPNETAFNRTILEPEENGRFALNVRPAPLKSYTDEDGLRRNPFKDNLKFHRTMPLETNYISDEFIELSKIEDIYMGFGGDLKIVAERLPGGVVEACLGNTMRNIQPLDDTTSVGPCTPYLTRKEAFCIANGFVDPGLIDTVGKLAETARKGFVNLTIDILTIKDELMEEKHKSRVFFNNDLYAMILCKIVLGDLVAKLKAHWSITSGAVGVNPHGVGWKLIFDKINKFSGGFVGGDFSGYDASLKRLFLELFFKFCNSYYRYQVGSPEWNELWSVVQMTFSAHYIYGNRVFTSVASNTSGNWITSFINSFISFTIFKMIFVYLRDSTDKKFEECFSGFFYGDDNIGGVREDCREFFNNVTIAQAAKKLFGMTYTGPTKGDVIEPFLARDELIFLGRGFREEGEFVFAPLRETALNGMLFWSRDKKHEFEIFDSNMDVIARECAHYEEHVYDSYIGFITKQLTALKYPSPPIRTYRYWKARIRMGYYENDNPNSLMLEL